MRIVIIHRPDNTMGGDMTAVRAFARELRGIGGIDITTFSDGERRFLESHTVEERPANNIGDVTQADHVILWGACSPEWGLPAAIQVRQQGKPLIVVAEWWSRRQRLDYFFHFDEDVVQNYTPAVAQTFALAEVVFVSTASEAQEVWKIVPRTKVHIIGRGCDPVNHAPVATPQDYVCCLARVEKHKNQVNLAHACRELGYKLKLVGPVVDEAYARIAEGLGAEPLGELPHDEAINVLANARVHALVSFFESAGLSSMEAMQLGVPAVMGRVGCQVELFGAHGIYADPTNWHDIRDAVQEAWDAPREAVLVPTWNEVAERALDWMEASHEG